MLTVGPEPGRGQEPELSCQEPRRHEDLEVSPGGVPCWTCMKGGTSPVHSPFLPRLSRGRGQHGQG